MERVVYLDNDGNRHQRSEWDMHHVIPRSIMKTTGERNFSVARGLLLPIYKRWHNRGKDALHSNVPLAPKPCRDLMHIVYKYINDDPTEGLYDRFLGISGEIHRVAETTANPGLQKNAERIARNLELQTPYILSGMVTMEKVDE